MEYYNINLNRINLKSADLVYIYANGEGDRYSKTDQGIVCYHTNSNGNVTSRLVPEQEMSITDFNSLKEISDEEYLISNTITNRETRNTVPLSNLENSDLIEQEESVEDSYIREMSEHERILQTWDIGMDIIESCLTSTQKRRYIQKYYEGFSAREIAEKEGVHHSSVDECLESAEKKIKIFLKSFRKIPRQTP